MTPVGEWDYQPGSRVLLFSPVGRDLLGLSSDAVPDLAQLREAIDSSDFARLEASLAECASGRPVSLEVVVTPPDGDPRRVRLLGRRIETVTGPAIAGTVERCDRMHEELEQLRGREARYRAFVERSSEAIWRFELTSPVPVDLPADEQADLFYRNAFLAECNDAMAQMYGFPNPDDLLGASLGGMLPREDPANEAYLREIVESGYRLEAAETIETDRFGNRKIFLNRVVGIIENGLLLQVWGSQRDVTEARLAAEAREDERRFLAAVLDNVKAGVVACNAFGEITIVNRSARALLGIDEQSAAEGRWIESFTLCGEDEESPLPTELNPLYQALRGEVVTDAPVVITSAGRKVHLLCSGQALASHSGRTMGAVVAMHDVTETLRAEAALRESDAQLRQAQKMEAVGRLAAGVAHDFNNLLTVISGYAALTLQQLREPDPLRDGVEEMAKAAERGSALTRQLLVFGRKRQSEPRALDVNSVVVDIERLLGRLIGEDVAIELSLGSDLPTIQADPTHLEQLVINLAVNARDAMPSGGSLTVATSRRRLVAPLCSGGLTAAPGEYAVLTVADTGTGMDAGTLSHIFEPFFTTKASGKGTGLGLSTVYGIVKQSGGCVTVESAPGRGSRFEVYLPAGGGGREIEDSTAPVLGAENGRETVLLVEDDPGVRRLAASALRERGYRVIEASDGAEAVRLGRELGRALDVLVSDLVLPGMRAREVVAELRRSHPELRVLLVSGYMPNESACGPADAFLGKPFLPEELARAVRQVLEATRLVAIEPPPFLAGQRPL